MLELPFFQVNAFTDRPFGGNPAGVCILKDVLPDSQLQNIATEADFSETAFLLKRNDGYDLRWFTPKTEVSLCGHATLASASVVLERLEPERVSVVFLTRSGRLSVARDGQGGYCMDFPRMAAQWTTPDARWERALGLMPTRVGLGDYGIAVFDGARDIRNLTPCPTEMLKLEQSVLIATAPGDGPDTDFVLRVFGPKLGIPEDPVTGSALCVLTPYWADRLGRDRLSAMQLSPRGGRMGGSCLESGRIAIWGTTWIYTHGWLRI